ncbi:MAG: TolC family protein [Bacteroidales bacterium]
MNLQRVKLLSALLLLSYNAFAQDETFELSLSDAQEYAVQNNLEKKNAAIDVDIADRKVWETTAMGLPQISSGVDFQAILNELPKFTVPGPPGPDGQPTQMEIDVGERVNATFSITASQLLFSGPYIVGLQASKAYKTLSENALAKTEREIKSNVASAYYTVLLLRETTSILDSSAANLRQSYNETREMHKAGFVEEVAADQVKVSMSMVENSSRETVRQLQSAKNLLKLHMGIDMSRTIELTDNLESLLGRFSPSIDRDVALDPKMNIDLRIMENQIELSSLQLKREKSEYLPSLSAFITYQKLAKEPEVNLTPEAIAGINLSLPIFSSGTKRSKVQQANLELQKARNTYEQTKQGLTMELADAKAQLSTAWEKYTSQKENKELAGKVYQNFREKYSKGMASQQDVIQANDKHLQALGDYMGAVVELFNAKLKVDKIIGDI